MVLMVLVVLMVMLVMLVVLVMLVMLGSPGALSQKLTLQHGLHCLPFKLRESGGVPESFSEGIAVYLQFGYLEQRDDQMRGLLGQRGSG